MIWYAANEYIQINSPQLTFLLRNAVKARRPGARFRGFKRDALFFLACFILLLMNAFRFIVRHAAHLPPYPSRSTLFYDEWHDAITAYCLHQS